MSAEYTPVQPEVSDDYSDERLEQEVMELFEQFEQTLGIEPQAALQTAALEAPVTNSLDLEDATFEESLDESKRDVYKKLKKDIRDMIESSDERQKKKGHILAGQLNAFLAHRRLSRKAYHTTPLTDTRTTRIDDDSDRYTTTRLDSKELP